jgi:hypothetical protein
VLEVLQDGINGLSVDFFSHSALAERIDAVLDKPNASRALRSAARATAVNDYDLRKVLLPRWERLIGDLTSRRHPAQLEDAASARPVRRIARVRYARSSKKGSKRA